ncbi:unnamed protein product [Paramecium pentaurelia]|uniref:Uncharacterized protein n=1 Tax=Paramecium pentaurelia TaxID=43138 RepID=A0A8S1WDW2_9CILI|nr:unnamed protein product [Paramecium pentaurelia]
MNKRDFFCLSRILPKYSMSYINNCIRRQCSKMSKHKIIKHVKHRFKNVLVLKKVVFLRQPCVPNYNVVERLFLILQIVQEQQLIKKQYNVIMICKVKIRTKALVIAQDSLDGFLSVWIFDGEDISVNPEIATCSHYYKYARDGTNFRIVLLFEVNWKKQEFKTIYLAIQKIDFSIFKNLLHIPTLTQQFIHAIKCICIVIKMRQLNSKICCSIPTSDEGFEFKSSGGMITSELNQFLTNSRYL